MICISVEHVLRPGCSLFYFIYNAPRTTKPKDVLQFIFLRSPHKPKSKDFLQLVLLIFYFEYSLKTWRNPFLATNFLLCTSSSRSYFTSWRSTNCLPVHLSNHQNLVFQDKITLLYRPLFSKKCDLLSRVQNSQYNMAQFSQKARIKPFLLFDLLKGFQALVVFQVTAII